MKLWLLVILVGAVAAIGAAKPPNATAAVASGGCRSQITVKACPKHGKIVIVGQRAGQRGRRGGGPSTDPPGTVRLIECGPGAGGTLQALGLPAAGATACTDSLELCKEPNPTGGRRFALFISVTKQAGDRWAFTGTQCGLSRKPVVTVADVRARVVRLVPPAAIGLAPKTATLVNIDTIMWVDAPTQQALAPVMIFGQRVLITLRINGVAWAYGDGTHASAQTAGKPYDPVGDPCRTARCPDYFSHTYTDTGSRTITAQARWSVSFSVDGAAPVTIPGGVAGPAAQARIVVHQARSELVPSSRPS